MSRPTIRWPWETSWRSRASRLAARPMLRIRVQRAATLPPPPSAQPPSWPRTVRVTAKAGSVNLPVHAMACIFSDCPKSRGGMMMVDLVDAAPDRASRAWPVKVLWSKKRQVGETRASYVGVRRPGGRPRPQGRRHAGAGAGGQRGWGWAGAAAGARPGGAGGSRHRRLQWWCLKASGEARRRRERAGGHAKRGRCEVETTHQHYTPTPTRALPLTPSPSSAR